ncbi:ABC transporter type 1, transmembrane domain-containing protein [Irpex lacteus]|nr:ABC transporter type 1, transmembrane domain-containing protein [Irpex lacteus]
MDYGWWTQTVLVNELIEERLGWGAIISSLDAPIQRLFGKRETSEEHVKIPEQPSSWFGKRGTATIFAFKFTRLLALLALFVLTVVSSAKVGWTWYNVALVLTSVYSTVLGVFNAFATVRPAITFSFHLSVVSFATLALYFYRDVWPLTTFTLHPADEAEGQILWAKVALAGLAGFVLPIFEPYPYIPVDPFASRVKHLSSDQLPPLADYDSAKNLIKRGFHRLDPFSGAPKRNLFFGLVVIFRRSLILQVLCIVFLAASMIAGPIGTNRLLTYLENGGEDAIVKPWLWILLIAASPIVYSLLWQLYIYLSTASLVRTEAIITSLVFEHALRIRLKAETGDKKEGTESAPPSAPASDTERSNTPEEGSSEGDDEETVHSRSATAASSTTTATSTTATTAVAPEAGKVADTAKTVVVEAEKEIKKKTSNFMGKINNLVTSDLENITTGRDFLFLLVSCPLQLALGMWFLYAILGWSSFVGLAVMVALTPVPGWVASLTSTVQKQKMKATDARVQNVTEMMSVLRMIKLFGWESRVKESVSEKREEELKWVWKRKLLGMASNTANHTIPLVHMVVTYGVYTAVQKKPLTGTDLLAPTCPLISYLFVSASIVFSSMTAFNMIRTQLFRVFGLLPVLITANVSLGRIAEFLRDRISLLILLLNTNPTSGWSCNLLLVQRSLRRESDAVQAGIPLAHRRRVVFKKGAFNLIIGPTESWTNLPREGGVAYAAQESWVQNETIKENIVFGSPFDEERYKKGSYIPMRSNADLSLFEAGDATEVGEKGLTLSGGQKARVTLARAVYSRAEIVLLDDVLQHWMYTLHAGLLTNVSKATYSVAERLYLCQTLPEWLGWEIPHRILDWMDFRECLGRILRRVGLWWLGYWARQYAERAPSEVSIKFYLSIYIAIVLTVTILWTYAEFIYTVATLRASRVIHSQLVTKLLGSTFRWLDVTPTSRVIARCTQDMQSIDGQVANMFNYLGSWRDSEHDHEVRRRCYIHASFHPPSIFIAIAGGWLGNVYIKAQLSVKREMSNAKAPVLGIVGGAIAGLTSIRAYAVQDAFRQETYKRVNSYVRVARVFYNLNRWVSVRIDALAAIFSSSLAFYLVYGGRGYTPSSIGFVLNMASGFSEMILWWVRIYNEFEVNGNSLERVHQYVTIEQEPEPKDGGVPPAYWPSSGKLEVENSPQDTPLWTYGIRKVNTHTGSPSLHLYRGKCIYDGIPTNTLNLDALRSNVTIILKSLTLDTEIASGGGNLSVGQRQIIALARAIVRQSKLLILDEATSAIDYETDAVIQESLRNELKSDVTVLLLRIAYKPSWTPTKCPRELLKRESLLRALVDESADKDALYAMAEASA